MFLNIDNTVMVQLTKKISYKQTSELEINYQVQLQLMNAVVDIHCWKSFFTFLSYCDMFRSPASFKLTPLPRSCLSEIWPKTGPWNYDLIMIKWCLWLWQGQAQIQYQCTYPCNGGVRRGMGCGFDIFQKFPSNSLPMSKSFQSNAQKFPHLGPHMAAFDLSFTYVLVSSKG